MKTLKQIDATVGEILQQLDSVGGELFRYKSQPRIGADEADRLLAAVAKSIFEIWKARDELYARQPKLKPNFKRELDDDPFRYERLSELSKKAQALENTGKLEAACEIYKRLLSEAKFGFFKNIAQDGINRCKVENQPNNRTQI